MVDYKTKAVPLNMGYFDTAHPRCHCDDPSTLMTSYTAENPGRRYYRCSGFNLDQHSCAFFQGLDDEGYCRGQQAAMVLALSEYIEQLTEKNKELLQKEEKMSKEYEDLRMENTLLIVDSIERNYLAKNLPKYSNKLIWPAFIAFGVGILFLANKKGGRL